MVGRGGGAAAAARWAGGAVRDRVRQPALAEPARSPGAPCALAPCAPCACDLSPLLRCVVSIDSATAPAHSTARTAHPDAGDRQPQRHCYPGRRCALQRRLRRRLPRPRPLGRRSSSGSSCERDPVRQRRRPVNNRGFRELVSRFRKTRTARVRQLDPPGHGQDRVRGPGGLHGPVGRRDGDADAAVGARRRNGRRV